MTTLERGPDGAERLSEDDARLLTADGAEVCDPDSVIGGRHGLVLRTDAHRGSRGSR
jgi:hypothetical protein